MIDIILLFLFSLFILGCGYYTLTYGISLWREDDNKLAGFGTMSLAVVGSVAPIIVMFLKQ